MPGWGKERRDAELCVAGQLHHADFQVDLLNIEILTRLTFEIQASFEGGGPVRHDHHHDTSPGIIEHSGSFLTNQ